MALILNIETSTEICSVCISDGLQILAKKEISDEKSHASKLTVFIQEFFEQLKIKASDLSAVAVSQGPGSYTGLRIGVSTAKGIAYASGIPLIALDSFKALALKVKTEFEKKNQNIADAYFCPMIDARRMEVYTATYDNEMNMIEEISAKIIDTNSFQNILKSKKMFFFGNGAEKCSEIIKSENAIFLKNISLSAENLVPLANQLYETKNFVDVAYFEPFYLKNFIATTSKKNIFS